MQSAHLMVPKIREQTIAAFDNGLKAARGAAALMKMESGAIAQTKRAVQMSKHAAVVRSAKLRLGSCGLKLDKGMVVHS